MFDHLVHSPRLHARSKRALCSYYADDSAAGSSLENLKIWWDLLEEIGPLYGYFPNGSKTHLLVKPDAVERARALFKDTGINICTEGKRYLGGAIGGTPFLNQFANRKVQEWANELRTLSTFAKTQPHAAYAAFTHGLSSKWTYFLRVTCMEDPELLQPLESVIRQQFIPALTGKDSPGDLMRELLALPASLGGLSITNPITISAEQHSTSKLISAPLVKRVIEQDHQLGDCHGIQQQAKAAARSTKRLRQKEAAKDLHSQFSSSIQHCIELSQEKGVSTWLSALPIDDHGFALHKSAFRDALSLRYNWPLENTPSSCSCGHQFSVDHALSCPTGGFPSIRHNEVRDITASLLSEVCHCVSVEPSLQPLSGEVLSHRSANTQDNARLDVAAHSFWGGSFERHL